MPTHDPWEQLYGKRADGGAAVADPVADPLGPAGSPRAPSPWDELYGPRPTAPSATVPDEPAGPSIGERIAAPFKAFGRGLNVGATATLPRLAGGLAKTLSDLDPKWSFEPDTGPDLLARAGHAMTEYGAERGEQLAAEHGPSPGFKEAPVSWLAENLGQALPSTLPAIAGGVAGGPAGALAVGAALGAGDIRGELEEAGMEPGAGMTALTLGGAVPYALVDRMMPGRVGSQIAKGGAARGFGPMFKSAMRSGVEEGVAEGAQSAISQGAAAIGTGQDIDLHRIGEEAVRGAAAGPFFGAGGQALASRRQARQEPVQEETAAGAEAGTLADPTSTTGLPGEKPTDSAGGSPAPAADPWQDFAAGQPVTEPEADPVSRETATTSDVTEGDNEAVSAAIEEARKEDSRWGYWPGVGRIPDSVQDIEEVREMAQTPHEVKDWDKVRGMVDATLAGDEIAPYLVSGDKALSGTHRAAANDILETIGRGRPIGQDPVESLPPDVQSEIEHAGGIRTQHLHEEAAPSIFGREPEWAEGSVTPAEPSAVPPKRQRSVFPGDDRKVETEYQVMEADLGRASHTSNYTQRPAGEFPPEIQGRAYHGTRGRQAREHTEQIVSTFDTDRALDRTQLVSEGPPVITPSGVVVAGNGRMIAQQKLYEDRPDAGQALKAAITEEAADFGIDPATVAGMSKPVLVRRITDESVDVTDINTLRELNTSSDQPVGKTKDPISEAATKAASFREAHTALEHFASTAEPDATIRSYLGTKSGRDFLTQLVDDGVITKAERARYADATTGAATEEGKTLVERMFYMAALGDADTVSRAPPVILRKIDTSLPAIIRADQVGGEWEVGPLVRDAIDLLASARAGDMKVDDLANQVDFERPAPPESVVSMAKFLESGKANVRDAFRAYANQAESFSRQTDSVDMFGHTPAGPKEAGTIFRQAALAPHQGSAAQAQTDIFGFVAAPPPSRQRPLSQGSIFGDRNPELAEGWTELGKTGGRFAFRDPEGNVHTAPGRELEQETGLPKGITGGRDPEWDQRTVLKSEDPVGSGNLFEGVHPLAPTAQLSEKLRDAGTFHEGTATVAPKSTAIVRDLQKVLQKALGGVKVAEGGNIFKRALAVVTPRSGVVRSRSLSDVAAIGHEYGHLMQKLLIGTDDKGDISNEQLKELPGAVRGELEDIAKGISDESIAEGWAEVWRRYLDNPGALEADVPNAKAWIEEKLDAFPAVRNGWDEAREQWRVHRDASPQARVRSHVSIGEKDPDALSIDDKWLRFRTNMLDDFEAIRKVVSHVRDRTGDELTVAEDAATLARLSRGANGIADLFIGDQRGKRFIGGPVDFGTLERKGKSLTELLEPVKGDIDDFRDYMIARRARELHGRDILTGIRNEDVEWTLDKLESDEFKAAFDDLQDYNAGLLSYLADSGVISQDSLEEIRKVNKDYVPFYRVHEGRTGGLGGGSGFGNLWSPVKRLKGSGRDIIDPLESIVKNTYSYVQLAQKQRVSTALASLAEKESVGDLFEKLLTPMRPQQFSVGEIEADLKESVPGFDELVAKLKERGADPSDDMLAIFRPGDYLGKPNTISVLKEGKRQWFEVDPELYRSLEGLEMEQLDGWVRWMAKPARTLRAGATLAPEFLIRNPLRDQVMAFVQSEYGYRPFWDLGKGIFEYVKKGDMYEDFMASGANNGTLLGLDRDSQQRNIRKLVESGGVPNVVKDPLDILRALSETLEQGTRMGEFMRAREKLGDDREAIQKAGAAAREVSTDFARHGAKTTALRAMSAFWNARLQGYDQLGRAIKNNPVRFAAKAFAGITLPSMMEYFAYRDDEEYWEIPQWQRDIFWVAKVGDSWLRIPKPFELGLIFGTMPVRILSAIEGTGGGAHEVRRFFEDTLSKEATSIGPTPTAIMPLVENMTNWSFFRQRPIVPRSEQNVRAREQGNERTSEVAKMIARWSPGPEGVSPRKIDNLLYAWTGGLGRLGTQSVDLALDAGRDKPPRPSPTAADIPGVRGVAVRTPGLSSESVERVYRELDKGRTAKATLRHFQREERWDDFEREARDPEQADLRARLPQYEGAADTFAKLRAMIEMVRRDGDMSPGEKRERIEKLGNEAIKVARGAVRD